MLQSAAVRTTLGFVVVALICLAFADLGISTSDPWIDLGRFVAGFVTPDFMAVDELGVAVIRTLAFAITGVALAVVAGFFLALLFRFRVVRVFCAFVRAIHELFWALIFLQFFGFHPLSGVLAIAIPFAGVFGKVYAEILDESDALPERSLPHGTGTLAAYLFTRIPLSWPHLVRYTSYRLECGLRSSAILGFVGLPTLGFYLESSFSEGYYSEVGALLIVFYVLIATLRLWLRPRLLPLYLLAAPFLLGSGLPIVWSNVGRFFTEDIVPAPLQDGAGWAGMGPWLHEVLINQALPGIWHTVVLTQIALVATGLLALLAFPLISRHFTGMLGGTLGHVLLVVFRSTPEYMLAFILLQMWGPSMLPAVVALAIHNGGIISHLIGHRSNEIELRRDASRGLSRYAFEILPRVYGPFLAFLFYRWEIIMRETAILGMLGITTLGFYVDSAISEIRFDRAMVLILITALLNIGVDALARYLRRRLDLRSTPSLEP
ncbi:ABC transporter permease [Aquisalimonas lutea]|uniref:PhnE/PtxC family ABC transporter permease n=1 Tax=Aquisalimonas lutea TaxID=1327750 RepID=UPI0025B368F0|nr:ABC transporter permease [Aquisalimonas lutea]MDN3518970.1 ABC transporter permease [Aquisalimonas lutea]